MSYKKDALLEIVRIVHSNGLTLSDIENVLSNNRARDNSAGNTSGLLQRVFGYIGGVFVFAGIWVFVSMFWNDMGSAARVVVTLGTGFFLFLIGLAALDDKRFKIAATPLFIASAALQPSGIIVMLREYSTGCDPRLGLAYMGLVMLLQYGLIFFAKQRTVLAFFSIIFTSIAFSSIASYWGLRWDIIGIVVGIFQLFLAYALGGSRHKVIAEFWYFAASICLFFFAWDILLDTPFELAFLFICGSMIFISAWAKSRCLLLTSVLSMLGYISYFTEEHFAHTLGWPIALVIIGISVIGLGAFAVKLNEKYVKASAT